MKRIIKQWAAPMLCGLVIFFLFNFVFFIGYVPSGSMEPTITAGSCIAGCRITGEIQRGDILVFRHDGVLLVKRAAAVPGDVIYIGDSETILSVNEEPYGVIRILTVPYGCYFMLGDNAENSIDSRIWDDPFITQTQVIAKVWK
jgi:signal peptidase I